MCIVISWEDLQCGTSSSTGSSWEISAYQFVTFPKTGGSGGIMQVPKCKQIQSFLLSAK